ncbi:alpha/beta hydrolase [Starkeya koreensis]|uniref:Alpha/beta hydrolase n=1 Tax=Ancylobacter koreensis TaxID=266121 RepID=A0ABT0DKF9_9HYPH|nr:alpha/beta fold hydrolase [Ancylobacter koreensis]MCK0207765.1 alpha/beta hydrolase [Ancylobacter koreensis]
MSVPAAALEVHLLDTPSGPVEWFGHGAAAPARGSFVLLHGIQSTAASWRGVAGHLDDGRALIIPNLRGRGRSHRPATVAGYTLAGFADDLAAVLAMAPRPVTLAGWSMGVLVTLATLDRHGLDGVSHLMLASGTARPGGEAVWFRAATPEELVAEAQARAGRLGLTEAADPLAVAGAWLSVRDCNLECVLPRITVPTLVLHGARDDECPPSHGRRIAALAPGARFELWEGAGHPLMAHDPQRLARTLLRLCAAETPATIVASQ